MFSHLKGLLKALPAAALVATLIFVAQASAQGPEYAVGLDGINDYCSASSSASLALTGSMTIEAWVYIDSIDSGQTHTIVSKQIQGLSNKGGYALVLNSFDELVFSTWGNDGIARKVIVSNDAFPFDQWTHVCGITKQNGTQMYDIAVGVNGNLTSATTTTANWGPASSNATFYIGKTETSTGTFQSFLDGNVDEVRLSNTWRYTPTNTTYTIPPKDHTVDGSTKAYYKFDNLASQGTDSSGNGNTLTVSVSSAPAGVN